MRLTPRRMLNGTAAVTVLVCYTVIIILWQGQRRQFSETRRNILLASNLSPTAETERSPVYSWEVSNVMKDRASRSVLNTDRVYVRSDRVLHKLEQVQGTDHKTGLKRGSRPRTLGGELEPTKTGVKTETEDIFIGIKTTKSFHRSRMDVILKTWFVLAKYQVYFFTDADDPEYQIKTGGHLINTNCSSSHNRKALCCKMSVELDRFLESQKKWFCHFDDDNYVNLPKLKKLLQKYNPLEDWYLGKPSIRVPLKIPNRENTEETISFWFATGGAGFCISRALTLKMMPTASGGRFMSACEKIRLPDDVTIGYIIEHVLKKKLTVVEHFHSHLEAMNLIKPHTFSEQISFSYSRFGNETNVISVEGFTQKEDPTRFLSLHCQLFPLVGFCAG
ncbi:fringe glycosyltransferase-like [Tachypleus tridentatus]|uniref:fringe glycosyltransferase-like n=1 Tax=Tachypleus tridentatus TaxID=6853 RepID=UPI003FD651E1